MLLTDNARVFSFTCQCVNYLYSICVVSCNRRAINSHDMINLHDMNSFTVNDVNNCVFVCCSAVYILL